MESKNAIILRAGEGKKVNLGGIEISFKSYKEGGNENWALCEYSAPPGFGGPPPHYHKIMEEAFYVLEGTLNVTVNKETIALEKGDYAYVPTGVVHTFSNKSNSPVKMLLLISPAGFEKYFFELEALIKTEGSFPLKDMTKALALMQAYDVHLPSTT